MRQVLFVDDEVRVLQGLERMLRVMRHEWQMEFVDDPRKAIALLERQAFDALVVDMRMPELDGAELLAKARELRPGTARIVLSGHAEREAAARSVALAHRFLAKPCDAAALKSSVSRACELRRLLAEVGLADTVCRLGKLPSLPRLYRAVTEELGREDASLKRVAQIIGQDVSMTAKILQIVNSAFFGIGRRVADVEQAVTYLGIDVIRSLVLSHAAFVEFAATDVELFQQLWRHSVLATALAKKILESRGCDTALQADALQAAMLHDLGMLVLAEHFPGEETRAHREAASGLGTLVEREQELFGCNHGRVGAYLLGLWGLPDGVVEAIAHHDEPSRCGFADFSPLTAVHVAGALIDEASGVPNIEAPLDMGYLGRVGCADQLPQWREMAVRVVSRAGERDG